MLQFKYISTELKKIEVIEQAESHPSLDNEEITTVHIQSLYRYIFSSEEKWKSNLNFFLLESSASALAWRDALD